MKKILSLLSMLMVTMMAFATDYTDQLTFKLTLGSSYDKALPEGTLTVEKRVDGTYNVTACGCDFSTYGFGNWADISCDAVEGTTDADGLTTIQVSKPNVYASGSIEGGLSLIGESLLVKFNGTKAYAYFKGKLSAGFAFEYTFGTDEGFESTGGGSTGGGETGGEVTEKYTVNFDKTAYHSRNDRVLSSFSLQQTGKDKQTVNVFASKAAYEDHTSSVFNVEAGSELTASFNYSGQWMNGYVYIDRDNDGEFSYKEGQWDQAGTDLVAYSFYTTLANPKVNDGNGYNSTGASVSGDDRSNVNPPSFTAPTEPGTYRIRFKIDWNCILPGGSSDILSDGGGVWDATLNVVAAEPEVTSDKTYTSNLKLTDAESEEDVVDMPQADVNIIKYSDDSYKITLKQVALRGAENDLVFVGTTPEVAPTAEAAEPLYISATPNTATKAILGDVTATFAISEVSDDEIKMGIAIEGEGVLYEGEFNYEEEKPEPEVYTSNLHIYDAAAPETDLFKADKANVEFLATETGEFTLTLKDVTLNEKTQDLVFTGTLPTTEPGGQEPLAEEGEGEVTPDEPAMVLNATADEATATFLGAASATAEFSISYNAADEFMMTFTMKAGEKNYGGEFNYEAKKPAAEPFCKENYVADGNGFEWEIPVDWDTQKIVMSIDPSTCTGNCEDVIGLGAVPTAWDNTLHLYRTSADQMLQGYFQTSATNNNTGKFAETAPFLVEVSKALGFVVNGEVKIAASAMSYLFTLPTVKMGTGEGANDKSRATYNYVKVVDKDWTKDPATGINATTVAEGEFEVFSVDGVKLSKLQKGLNIVRSADGKVKKVLVK